MNNVPCVSCKMNFANLLHIRYTLTVLISIWRLSAFYKENATKKRKRKKRRDSLKFWKSNF